MENHIFRKKSLDRISSPEQLNDYVRVSNPGVWMVFLAVILLLAGVCIWGIYGHLDTAVETAGICREGSLTCYVSDRDIASVKKGMMITANGKEYLLNGISESPFAVKEDADSYLLYVGKLEIGEWVYEVTADTDLEDGIYEVKIVTESVSPVSFVIN